MRTTRGLVGAAVLAVAVVVPARGQLPGPFGQGPGQAAPSKSDSQQLPPASQGLQVRADDYNRLLEILVELAWLGDARTCPYLLEAHVSGPNLQVRGHVPDRAVHDRALKIARLHCPLAVIDGLTERSGLASTPVQLAPAQLRQAAAGVLGASFPAHAHAFDVQCDTAGCAHVTGFAVSFEEKLAISKCLQRLHGCTANAVHVSADLRKGVGYVVPAAATGASLPRHSPTTTAPGDTGQFGHALVLVPEGDSSAAASEQLLRKRIASACGLDAKQVTVALTSAGMAAVYLGVPQAEATRLAPRILQLPEVSPYRLKIYVTR